jgi:hypothetical protein
VIRTPVLTQPPELALFLRDAAQCGANSYDRVGIRVPRGAMVRTRAQRSRVPYLWK